jgi:hypothetical protein
MDTWIWIAVAAAVVLVVAFTVVMVRRSRRRAELKARFRTEYDRTVDSSASRRMAELDLREREQRHSALNLHPLAPAARERYQYRWDEMQSHFIDRPQVAVADADSMITQVMRDLGYPVDDFETNAILISVEHADVVTKYREGHGVFTRMVEGTASTEDLRQAVLSYRALFQELMNDRVDQASIERTT